jgi:hypothetical protein
LHSLTLGLNAPAIVANKNTLDGILVADNSALRLDGGMITAARNGRAGLWFGGTAGLSNITGIILLEHNTEGVRAEDTCTISGGGTSRQWHSASIDRQVTAYAATGAVYPRPLVW